MVTSMKKARIELHDAKEVLSPQGVLRLSGRELLFGEAKSNTSRLSGFSL